MTENIIIKNLEYYQQKYNNLLDQHSKLRSVYWKERAERISLLDNELSSKYNFIKLNEEIEYSLNLLDSCKIEEVINDPINPLGTILYKYNLNFDYSGTHCRKYYTLCTPNIIGIVKVMTPELKKDPIYSNMYLSIGTKFIHVLRKNSFKKV